MTPDDNRPANAIPRRPQQQTDEEFGSIRGPQRGANDFKGKGNTPRGSDPELRGVSGRRG
jgi:hypothetical protein